MQLKSNQAELLKWIAIITMIIDHIGKIILNNPILLECIGRVAFPTFGFLLAHNYLFFTRNKEKYIFRIFLIGIFSQPIYQIATNTETLNIMFTLGLGLSFIYLINILYLKINEKIGLYFSYFLLSLIFIVLGFFVDYAFFGIFFIASIYLYLRNGKNIYIFLSVILLLLANSGDINTAPYALISLFVIFSIKKTDLKIKRSNKWFFYFFYPVHLLILYFISLHL
jgi:hypothetical protein